MYLEGWGGVLECFFWQAIIVGWIVINQYSLFLFPSDHIVLSCLLRFC